MKITERYKTLSDMPAVLPVFPLRGCILLPRAALPLNIFEPRYLAMFEAALSSHRLVAIVQPQRIPMAANDAPDDDADGESPPGSDVALRATGCVGRITAFQELDDNRLIVSLTGVTRCDMLDEVTKGTAYRRYRVSFDRFEQDLHPGLGEQDIPREQLLATLKRFLEARNLKADWSSISRSGSETLVNSLSVMSPYGPEEKQALLDAPSLKVRADMLIALAEMELAANGGTPGSTLQ